MNSKPAPILEINDLRAGYEDLLILDGVSIRVPAGSIVSLVGPNGAGKSTLLKAIYGLAAVRSGRVVYRVDGREWDITRWKPHRLTALGMNYVPQLDNVFPTLSVRENLQIGARGSAHRTGDALDRVFDTFPFLASMRARTAGMLSGGQRQMLALARALMSGPRLLFLDEPSAGLAPQVMDELFERLQQIHLLGVTIVMVEQNARRALGMSDYGYVLEGGSTRYEGPGESLLEDERVVQLYLGRRPNEALGMRH
jgi:ABC-type branched-subunit amino acid transport system ATPase component